ncbi:MAG: malectin domain-containing carbohydrate-binding protein, partial [Verrucomicrobiota bacterium]
APATIRIIAGLSAPLTDETGEKWLPSHDFLDGDTMDRPELKIANTEIPSIYRSERFGMSRFARRIPNGNYLVKLHFAITYEGIDGPGQCVFGYEVEGRAVKDFDLFVRAGGTLKAHVESIPVVISDGTLDIKFTSQVGNPAISAIEIVPQP